MNYNDDWENGGKKKDGGVGGEDDSTFGLPDFGNEDPSSGGFGQDSGSSASSLDDDNSQEVEENTGSILDYGGGYADETAESGHSDGYAETAGDDFHSATQEGKKGGVSFVVVIVVLLLVFSGIGFGAFYFLGKEEAERPALVNTLIDLTRSEDVSSLIADEEASIAAAEIAGDDLDSSETAGMAGEDNSLIADDASTREGSPAVQPVGGDGVLQTNVASSVTSVGESLSGDAPVFFSPTGDFVVPGGTASAIPPTSSTGQKEVLTARTGRYYVVVGSFLDGDFAENFTSRLVSKGYNVRLLIPVGDVLYYRVAISESATFQEAVEDAERWKAEFGGEVWATRH